ncbi:hypothetical protein Syun_029426 [Stephania yunnanensis]|uniref:At2g29880-like C-terminal domain-containing protein n=1 Tax=Stephania yunnanensis TaxID=152371 RepID=A0AAP0E9X9_9MAGN
MRATNEAFKKKFEQMSNNRKSEVGGPGTGISLHSARSISARQHCDTLAELTRRLDEMSTQTPDTSIDEDAVYLEVVQEVKGRVYGLGSQGYHRSISSGGASSSRGPAYGLHELEELQRDHQRLQETLLKERMERQEQMQRDKMERQEETREMQDRLARMEGLLMQHLGIRPHVPPTPQTPPSPGTKRSGPHSDDDPGHLTTEITPSQSGHPHDHRSRHLISPYRRMSDDQRDLLDDHDDFMEQVMPPPRCDHFILQCASGRYSIGLGDDTDARTFEVEETSGDVLEDLSYDYDAEAFVQRNEHQQKSLNQPPTVGSFNAPPTIEPMNLEVHSVTRKRNRAEKEENLDSSRNNNFQMDSLNKLTETISSFADKVDRFMARDQGCWKLIKEIPNLIDSTRFKVLELLNTKAKKIDFMEMSSEERSKWIAF